MSEARRPAVTSIPPGVPFLDALASGLIDRFRADPLALASATILLPTRRACSALAEAFLRQGDGEAMLLPRMLPLGDLDADELAFEAGSTDLEAGDSVAALDLPPAIPDLERRLLLARLIAAGGKVRPEQALLLAGELGRLIDQVAAERLDWKALDTLVPAEHAAHWQITLDVLAVIRDHWPLILAERGAIDPATRRDRLMAAQAERWQRDPPAYPIIAAGSTGSIPATADLLRVIGRLPQGMVVLPGLDRFLSEEDWLAVRDAPTHPQHGLARLIHHIGVDRIDVHDWTAPIAAASSPERAQLASLALAPAETIDLSAAAGLDPAAAMAGVTRLDCLGPQQEAGVIALLMREALERPEKTAALITPDRDLARRVASELARFGIAVDDSAGTPLDRAPVGMFLRLIADCVASRWAPIPLLALLKHPFTALGEVPATVRAWARTLELACLHGPRPAPGFEGLKRALGDADRDLLPRLYKLDAALRPLADAMAAPETHLGALVTAHLESAEALAETHVENGADILWAAEAGETAANLTAELIAAGDMLDGLPGTDYPAIFQQMAGSMPVRPRWGRHNRLRILGPLEARLLQADRVILGGLNEGTWPTEPGADPWLSRPMRRDFGLPPQERRIGQAAHDFAQAFAAREVFLTRSERIEGTPTVPSRWLQRIATVLQGLGWQAPDALSPDTGAWLHWQSELDRPARSLTIAPPLPKPPIAARPTMLPVTAVETWMRDPYALYARRILRLRALDPIDADAGLADRGRFIHAALDAFVAQYPGLLPADALEKLLELGRDAFAAALDRPSVWAFWWPRFERIARWFVATEADRRRDIAQIRTEIDGKRVFHVAGRDFVLTAKADRLDLRHDGSLEIVDYKTGRVPSMPQVGAGYAPQLPLEALIALANGFPGVAPTEIAGLAFWKLSGGDPPGEVIPVKIRDLDLAALIERTEAGLIRLVEAYSDPAVGYPANPRPHRGLDYNDYAHLARLAEWSTGGDDGGEA